MRFMLHHERHLAGFRACIFLMVVLVDLKVGFVGERSALSARLLWYGVLAENAGCFLWDKSRRRRVLVCVYAFGMALKEAPTEAETATPPPLAAPPHADPRLTPRRSAAASPPLGIKTFQQVKNKIYNTHTHRGEQKKETRNSFISLARRMHFTCRPWTATSLIYFFIVGKLDRWISGSIKHVNWRRERCFKYDFRSRGADGVIKQHSTFFWVNELLCWLRKWILHARSLLLLHFGEVCVCICMITRLSKRFHMRQHFYI